MMEKNNYEPPIPDFPQPQHKFDNMIGEIITIEEIIKTKEIVLKVYEEGFDKVSEELSMNPDYLGNARHSVAVLEKAEMAAKATLDLIKKIREEIYKNY